MTTEAMEITPGPGAEEKANAARGVRGSTALVCLLFVLSGACGLAYQVVWSKYLGLFLGNTVLLHTAVLGAFMGGLALGSLAIGTRASRWAAPLKMYGYLELAIAVYAFVFPQLAELGQGWVIGMAGSYPPGSTGLVVVRVAAAFGLLIVPTVLMGATYPFLTAHLERQVESGERGANWLYAANCAGAVIGALVTGLGLIPEWGIPATVMAIAILNALVGIVAILAGGSSGEGEGPARTAEAAAASAAPRIASEPTVLIAICLSGATAFIYELVWTRLFAVTLGSSTYSFTLMLAAFITGLALGSVVSDLIPAVRRHPWAVFAGAELAIGLAIALALPLYPRLPYWLWKMKWLLRASDESLGIYFFLQYALIFSVMAVPTFLFGLTFPAAIRAAAGVHPPAKEEGSHGSVADHAAAVYGWNTIGTLVGVVLAGCVLIPLLGLRGSLIVGAAANLGIGLLVAARGGNMAKLRFPVVAAAGGAVAVLVLAPAWHPLALTFGAFRAQGAPPDSWRVFSERLKSRKEVFYKEDFGTTVAVLHTKDSDGQHDQLSLIVDGKTDASSVGDLATQTLLAHVPMFTRPKAKEVFVVGLGSGVTVGSVLAHPVDRVDCAEISRAVVDGARHFKDTNRNALADPRLNLVIDDGRTVLSATRKQYDLIISEPTNPWISGVGNLFSEEFFVLAASRLKPDGVIAQWFHGYELDDKLVATILRTFRGVFPYAVVFQGNSSDYIILGSRQPLNPDFVQMDERLKDKTVAADLERIGIRRTAGLLALQLFSESGMEELSKPGGINSDNLPLLEYLAPRSLYKSSFANALIERDERQEAGADLWIRQYLSGRAADPDDYASMLRILSDTRVGSMRLHEKVLRAYLERWPQDEVRLLELARLLKGRNEVEGALEYARRAAAAGSTKAASDVTALQTEMRSRSGSGLLPAASIR